MHRFSVLITCGPRKTWSSTLFNAALGVGLSVTSSMGPSVRSIPEDRESNQPPEGDNVMEFVYLAGIVR